MIQRTLNGDSIQEGVIPVIAKNMLRWTVHCALNRISKMKSKLLLLPLFYVLFSLVATGCGPSAGSKAQTAKVTSHWKWTPKPIVGNIAIADPKGIVIEQTGDQIEASFYTLKEGDGFVVEKKVSTGKYYADKQKLVLPIGPNSPGEFDQYLALDVYRMEASLKDFSPTMPSLHVKWVGNGPYNEVEFVRVQE